MWNYLKSKVPQTYVTVEYIQDSLKASHLISSIKYIFSLILASVHKIGVSAYVFYINL